MTMIYFDNAATSPLLPIAYEALIKELSLSFANPSSAHAYGREAKKRLDGYRNSMLHSFGLSSTDYKLIFTSGATESNNLAIKGILAQYPQRGKKVITSLGEHPSVLNVFKSLETKGYDVIYLPLTEEGKVDPSSLERAIDKDTLLVSIMAVNNETGAINDLEALSLIVHKYPKAFFHSDITQAAGKMELPLSSLDLASFSGHKFGSPKGVGGLLLRKKITLSPQNIGGEQEEGERAGTYNLASIASMAVALEEETKSISQNDKVVREIRDYLRDNLSNNPEILPNSPLDASPYIWNFSLSKKKASVLLEALSLKGIYISSVSACSSKGEPSSYVLEAMGLDKGRSMNSIRLSFSPSSSMEEAKEFLPILLDTLKELTNR